MQWWNATSEGTVPWPMVLPMLLWPIFLIGGVVALVVLLFRGGRTRTPSAWRSDAGGPTAFEILRERFARGEIDRQEYEERKGLLSQP
jgi:putative membrane protein